VSTEEHPLTWLIQAARQFYRKQEGASIAEYALLLTLITIVCMAGMTILAGKINSFYSAFSTTI